MKCISLWQPYASLIAVEAKPFETRSWAPPRALIGERIAIHAAKKIDKGIIPFVEDIMYGQHKNGGFELSDKLEASMNGIPKRLWSCFGNAMMPTGCIVATARLEAAFQLGEPSEQSSVPAARVIKRVTSRPIPECFTVRYDDFGDYAPGRWAWLLTDVKPLTPTEVTVGRQGFFDVPEPADKHLRAAE